ncbi:MAG TPA: hypothetical protein DCO77_11160 [Nitrospiraceae bacterium]|nr:hypothetical protein [Nitrospiraceae bacterium]
MKVWKVLSVLSLVLVLASSGYGAGRKTPDKKKILVVDSYHREYSWSQETNKGFCAAMLKYRYFENLQRGAEYTKNDYVETSKVIVKKIWMDTKRKKSKAQKEEVSVQIYKTANEFQPDLIFLGDDNAARYIGGKFLDTKMPIIFWGVNNTPVKYGLVDSIKRPGHNVTGVYQSGYYAESLRLLKVIVPGVQTIAVLSDNTPTGRSHYKAIEYLARKGVLPVTLVETVATDSYEEWKRRALELQKSVDAFFVAHYAGFKDSSGKYVPGREVAAWYRAHIRIPEAVELRHFVNQGMLCGADDSAYNQGYEAVVIAHDILTKGANPATYPPRAPKRGALMVNTQRAKDLGIVLTKKMGIEEYIETNGQR